MARIWCNASLPTDALDLLRRETAEHELILDNQAVPNLGAAGASPTLESAQIAFGQPDADQVMALPNLKWVHITSAGYTRYDREDFKKTLQDQNRRFTTSSTVFADPCAQHVLAFMLAHARQIPTAVEHQITDHSWRTAELRLKSSLLTRQSVLLVGYGAIAQRLAELLAPFDMKIKGFRRQVSGHETIPTYPIDRLEEFLQTADHIVNILPANPSTDRFFNAARLAMVKPGAVFYNIGRGTTVDQLVLSEALETGALQAAYLDVTDPEPLPPDHKLWHTPRCLITPHTAGGSDTEYIHLVEHFIDNLRRYENGDRLLDRII